MLRRSSPPSTLHSAGANPLPADLDVACASSSTAAGSPPWPPTASTSSPPHIEVLEPDHPERRFASALCLYSHAVDSGQAGVGFYDQEDAERYARALLMPVEECVSLIAWPDVELAELNRRCSMIPAGAHRPAAVAGPSATGERTTLRPSCAQPDVGDRSSGRAVAASPLLLELLGTFPRQSVAIILRSRPTTCGLPYHSRDVSTNPLHAGVHQWCNTVVASCSPRRSP